MSEKTFECGCQGICHGPAAKYPAWQLFTLCSKHRNVNYYYPTIKHLYECGCFRSQERDEYASPEVYPCSQHQPLHTTYHNISQEKAKKIKVATEAINLEFDERINKARNACFMLVPK